MSSSTETPSIDKSEDQSQPQSPFQYAPLEPSNSSIRLVVLERPKLDYHYKPEIRCRILHTVFKAKPKYEALSYTWGTEISREPIILDEHPFHVSLNLYHALFYLGNTESERTLWIDAICINQKDFDERNSQIQLMPFIYKRAENVVVWLGGHLDLYFNPRKSKYWQRLWVIQEVAKARRLKVSWAARDIGVNHAYPFTLRSQNWKDFIEDYDSTNVSRFKTLREERYGESSLLRNLLQKHQSAQCKDPRDKIYGLVGLSTDCSGRLPMDYRKSLWEVYKDVISVYDGYPGILELSRILKSFLGGPEQIPAQDLEKDEDPKEYSLNLDPEEPATIKVPAYFLGTIVHVGPTYNEVISLPQKANEWDAAIEQNVNHRKPEIRERSDLFLEALENTNEEALMAALSLPRKTSWRPLQDHVGERVLKILTSNTRPKSTEVEECLTVSLFLLHDEHGLSPKNAMGICCEGAAAGDFVFQIPTYGLAIVTRSLPQVSSWKLIGFAGIAMTVERYKKHPLHRESQLQFDVPDASREIDFILCLDMPTLFRLSD